MNGCSSPVQVLFPHIAANPADIRRQIGGITGAIVTDVRTEIDVPRPGFGLLLKDVIALPFRHRPEGDEGGAGCSFESVVLDLVRREGPVPDGDMTKANRGTVNPVREGDS